VKIVLNRSIGAFRLSEAAIEAISVANGRIVAMNDYGTGRHREKLSELATRPINLHGMWLARTDKNLVEVVERLGKEAAPDGVELEVVDIPNDENWAIGDVCGIEYVRAAGRLWPKGAVDKNV
jgi:hypothetical protein